MGAAPESSMAPEAPFRPSKPLASSPSPSSSSSSSSGAGVVFAARGILLKSWTFSTFFVLSNSVDTICPWGTLLFWLHILSQTGIFGELSLYVILSLIGSKKTRSLNAGELCRLCFFAKKCFTFKSVQKLQKGIAPLSKHL
jgi:hypothetical protein